LNENVMKVKHGDFVFVIQTYDDEDDILADIHNYHVHVFYAGVEVCSEWVRLLNPTPDTLWALTLRAMRPHNEKIQKAIRLIGKPGEES
jgi:hypothetical protein